MPEIEEPVEPGKTEPSYAGFAILRLNEIWSFIVAGNRVKALNLTLLFASTCVPKKIKVKLEHKVEVIRKDLSKAYKTPGYDFHNEQVMRLREARKVANYYLTPFLSELSDLLDEWGFYEKFKRRMAHGKYEGE